MWLSSLTSQSLGGVALPVLANTRDQLEGVLRTLGPHLLHEREAAWYRTGWHCQGTSALEGPGQRKGQLCLGGAHRPRIRNYIETERHKWEGGGEGCGGWDPS